MEFSKPGKLSAPLSHENPSSVEPEVQLELKGEKLFEQLVGLTDLPAPLVRSELTDVLSAAGKDIESLNIEKLREVMLMYLELVQSEMSAAENQNSEN
jgi:hypothetical protein